MFDLNVIFTTDTKAKKRINTIQIKVGNEINKYGLVIDLINKRLNFVNIFILII